MAGLIQNWCLKYFPGCDTEDDGLQILLVSTSQQYLDELQRDLYITRQIQADKRTYKLKVHTCKKLEDISSLACDGFSLDFIVFILDVNNTDCFNQVRKNLDLLGLTFRREKMCLVNPNPSFNNSAVKQLDVWNFAENTQINLIVGKINDPEKLTNLSKRVLNLAEACCGVINGLPLVGFV